MDKLILATECRRFKGRYMAIIYNVEIDSKDIYEHLIKIIKPCKNKIPVYYIGNNSSYFENKHTIVIVDFLLIIDRVNFDKLEYMKNMPHIAKITDMVKVIEQTKLEPYILPSLTTNIYTEILKEAEVEMNFKTCSSCNKKLPLYNYTDENNSCDKCLKDNNVKTFKVTDAEKIIEKLDPTGQVSEVFKSNFKIAIEKYEKKISYLKEEIDSVKKDNKMICSLLRNLYMKFIPGDNIPNPEKGIYVLELGNAVSIYKENVFRTSIDFGRSSKENIIVLYGITDNYKEYIQKISKRYQTYNSIKTRTIEFKNICNDFILEKTLQMLDSFFENNTNRNMLNCDYLMNSYENLVMLDTKTLNKAEILKKYKIKDYKTLNSILNS
jgi:hypothetical protein